MINVLLKIKFNLESITESIPKEKRTLLSKIVLNGLKLIDTYVIFYYLKITKKTRLQRVRTLSDNDKLPIISLTSFPARLNNLWMVLYCIYNQTVLPGKIVVTLTKEEIPGEFHSLPNSLKYFADKGVEFIFADINLRPHNKYFYARQKYPNRIVITIDDDLLYYPDTIERLMRLHSNYPKAVCSNRVLKIKYEKNHFGPVSTWQNVFFETDPSIFLLGQGFSGVLYPESFLSKDLYNAKKIQEMSLGADDQWLRVQETLENVSVICGSYYAHPVTLPKSQIFSLNSENNGACSRNDMYLEKMNKHYNLERYYTI